VAVDRGNIQNVQHESSSAPSQLLSVLDQKNPPTYKNFHCGEVQRPCSRMAVVRRRGNSVSQRAVLACFSLATTTEPEWGWGMTELASWSWPANGYQPRSPFPPFRMIDEPRM
jgi:hypothetical protein